MEILQLSSDTGSSGPSIGSTGEGGETLESSPLEIEIPIALSNTAEVRSASVLQEKRLILMQVVLVSLKIWFKAFGAVKTKSKETLPHCSSSILPKSNCKLSPDGHRRNPSCISIIPRSNRVLLAQNPGSAVGESLIQNRYFLSTVFSSAATASDFGTLQAITEQRDILAESTPTSQIIFEEGSVLSDIAGWLAELRDDDECVQLARRLRERSTDSFMMCHSKVETKTCLQLPGLSNPQHRDTNRRTWAS